MKQVKLLDLPVVVPEATEPAKYFYATKKTLSTGEVEYKWILVQDGYLKGSYQNRLLNRSFTIGNAANVGSSDAHSLVTTIRALLSRGWEVMECGTLAEAAKWLDV